MKFTVLTPLRHDGEDHVEGNEIELSAKAAEPLIAISAVEPITAPIEPATKAAAKKAA